MVLRSFDVGAVYAPKAQANTRIFEEFLDAVEDKGLEITTAYKGRAIGERANEQTGERANERASERASDTENYKISILSPTQYANPEDLNDASVVISFTYSGDNAIMLSFFSLTVSLTGSTVLRA